MRENFYSGHNLVESNLIEVPVGSLIKNNNLRSKNGNYVQEGLTKVQVWVLMERKRRVLQTNSQSVAKKIKDDMEVDGEAQANSLAEVGVSQPRQSL